MTCTLHEGRYAFLFISRLIFLRMRNISDKSCRENRNTLFMLNNFFFPENRALCGVMWRNIVELGRPQMTVRPMRITCWVPKATKTLRICNSYCFSTATLYVHCLSCRSFTVLLLLLLLYDMDVCCHRPFLPGTVHSLEPAVIPTAQSSSCTLQYFPYYV